MSRSFFLILLILPFCTLAQSETETLNPDSIAYSVVLDQPEVVRRIYVGIQPIYADVFLNNVNAGFGVDALYLPKSGKFDLRMAFRKPYSTRFYDQAGDRMNRLSNTLNKPVGFMYFELSGSYTLKEVIKTVPSRVAVIKKSEKQNPVNWAGSSSVTIPIKLRVMKSVRAGVQAWRSAIDVTGALERQGSRNANVTLPEELIDEDGNVTPFYAYSNLYNRTIFAGYGLTRIKNQAVLFDDLEAALQDKILTWYADLMIATSLSLDDVAYGFTSYNLDKVNLNRFGMRAGADLRSNRDIGWGFGVELGWRPAPQKNTGYLMLKLSIPVFAGYLTKRD